MLKVVLSEPPFRDQPLAERSEASEGVGRGGKGMSGTGGAFSYNLNFFIYFG